MTSPPTCCLRASLSVIIPFDVEMIAIPKPFKTFGNSSFEAYTLSPGLLILFNPSTSKGLKTDKEARELGVGGEVLAFVW